MRDRLRLFCIAVLLLGCAWLPGQSAVAAQASDDQITRLVAKLAASHLWRNGIYAKVELLPTAATDQVIARVLEMTGFEKGHIKQYRILETRHVQIRGSLSDTYIAALVQTDLGDKVVLLKYEEATAGWWSRVYDAEPSE